MKLNRGHAVAGAALAAIVAIATPFVASHEGFSSKVYPDPVSHRAPYTYCYGETSNPEFGHTYSRIECDAKLASHLTQFAEGVLACVHTPLPAKTGAAFVSTAYNIGLAGFCNSSIAAKANAGDLRGACDRIPAFNHAGGHVVYGLTVRRGEEQRLCLAGVAEGLSK